MKRIFMFLVIPLLFNVAALHSETWNEDVSLEIEQIALDEPPNAKPQAILHSIANIVAHIGSIIGNPRNKQNVGHGVTGILGNIVNIALVASHRGLRTEPELLDFLVNELHLDQELKRMITQEAIKIHRTIALEAS